MKKLIGLILLLALVDCGKPPRDSLNRIATDSIWMSVISSKNATEPVADSTDGWTITPAPQQPDTGYYEKEIDLPATPVPGHPGEAYLTRNFRIFRVNRALKEVVRPVPKDTRRVCEDACPNCGGEMRWSNVSCPEGRSGCDVLHSTWVCVSCKKQWYYDGDPP